MGIRHKYAVEDLQGRRWITTLTRLKAARMVMMLKETKGIDCVIREL